MQMDFSNIQHLISQKESVNIEFKKSTGQLERGMETLCAFLNGNGGTVLFGVSDNGEIVGQEIADTTKRSIAEHIRDLSPVAPVEVHYIPIETSNKYIIAIYADESIDRPFVYKGRAYMRVESTTSVMSQEVYNQMLFARDGVRHRWESLVNPDLTISDLDEQEILKTVRLGIESGRLPENTGTFIPDILGRFSLFDNGQLNNAAAILFAKGEKTDYFQCMVRLARFRGIDKAEFIDNVQVRGNIFQLLDAAMSFVFKHLSLSGVVNGLEREEQLSVPYKALREAVINALCHREYRIAGASVGLAIYDDRVVIENPGTLPKGWKIEDLKSKKLSAAQNPIIANVLYKRRLLESWGRGISLMVDECVDKGLPEPEFEDSCGFVTVTFRYNNHISATQAPHKHHISTTQVTELVKVIGNDTLPVKDLMERLKLNNRSYFTKQYLQPAVNEGFITPIYPNQPRNPKQKYYLTEKGKRFVESC